MALIDEHSGTGTADQEDMLDEGVDGEIAEGEREGEEDVHHEDGACAESGDKEAEKSGHGST